MTSIQLDIRSSLAAREALRTATAAPATSTATSTGQIGQRVKDAADAAAYWSIPGASSTDGADELAGALSGVAASGPGALVEPDMDEEGAKLKAGQAQMMLAVRQMSIANAGNGANVLAMFR